jgi:hypothetical protein
MLSDIFFCERKRREENKFALTVIICELQVVVMQVATELPQEPVAQTVKILFTCTSSFLFSFLFFVLFSLYSIPTLFSIIPRKISAIKKEKIIQCYLSP